MVLITKANGILDNDKDVEDNFGNQVFIMKASEIKIKLMVTELELT